MGETAQGITGCALRKSGGAGALKIRQDPDNVFQQPSGLLAS